MSSYPSQLYNTVLRVLGLDETQLTTLFPLSFIGTTQRWCASLESFCRKRLGGLDKGVSKKIFIQ